MSDMFKNDSKDNSIFDAKNGVFSERELFDADEAAIDALLSRISDEEDAEVDYDAIYRGIEDKAKSEGLYVFSQKPVKNKRERTVKRFAQAALAVACACVAGLGIMSFALGARSNEEPDNPIVYDDPTPSANEVIPSEYIQLGATSSPDSLVVYTSSPYATSETQIDITPDPYGTPVPTKMAGVESRMELFTLKKITAPEKLIPAELPDYMYTRYHSRDLRASSMGYDSSGNSVYYDCAVTLYSPYELSEGEIVIVIMKDGSLCAYWHVNETQFLYICMEGFDYDEAVSLMKSYSDME